MKSTYGEQLRAAREEQKLSLDDLAEELHIKPHYLKALEADNLDAIPSKPQARGFLRIYAARLGVVQAAESVTTEETSPQQLIDIDPTESSIEHDTSTPHHVIFKEIGESLKERREILGLSIEDIEAHTRIPAHYVQYIETGAFDQFPSPAQSRGMLNNYLQFLDIGSENIMARYAEALQTSLAERSTPNSDQTPESSQTSFKPPILKVPQWVRMFLSPDLFLITTIGIIVVGLTIWGIGRVTRTQAEQAPLPTAPSLVEALLPTSTTEPTSTLIPQDNIGGELIEVDSNQQENEATPTFEITGSSIQTFLIIRQRTYLRVIVDGETQFDGRTIPGTNLTFAGQDEIKLLSGNAAAIQVFLNDQDLGVLGIFGEVVEIFYTQDGIIRPTKQPTATASPTLPLTETPVPTSTANGIDLPPEQNTPVP